MAKVKFNMKTLDADTQYEYLPSDEFVEVSEAFVNRLRAADPSGLIAKFEESNSDNDEVNSLLSGLTPEGVEELKKEMLDLYNECKDLSEQNKKLLFEKEEILNERSQFENQLSEAYGKISELEAVIKNMSEQKVEEKPASDQNDLFVAESETGTEDKPKPGRPRKTDD